MSDESEIYKIIMKVENEEKVKSLSAAIAKEEDNLRQLISTLGRHDAATKASAAAIAGMHQELKKAEAGAGIASHKIMALGQTLDDLQYVGEQGLRPIINNVMQLSPAIGIAMIAAQSLYNNWDSLAKLLGMGATKTEAEQMEELAKKTEKTADETARLAKYEELRQHIAAQAQKPEAQKKFGNAVDEAVREGPADEINKGLDKHFGNRIRTMAELDSRTKEVDERMAKAREDYEYSLKHRGEGQDTQAHRENIEAIQREKDAIYGEAREKFRGELGEKPGTAAAVAAAAKAHPDDFGPNGRKFAESMEAASPEAQKAKAEAAAQKIQDEFWDAMAAEGEKAKKIVEEFWADHDKELDEWLKAVERADKAVEEFWDAMADEAEKLKKKAIKEKEDQEKERLKAAKETPGIESVIRDLIKANGGGQRAEEAMTAQLLRRFDPTTAATLAHEGRIAADDELMADFLKGPDIHRRKSSVIGAEGLANSIQSAVGGDDTAKKSLEQLKRQTAVLEWIRQGNGRQGGAQIVAGPDGFFRAGN